MAYHRVCTARSGFPAPMFCAPSAETVDSMDDGTRNTNEMNFLHDADRRRVRQTAPVRNDRDDDERHLNEAVLESHRQTDAEKITRNDRLAAGGGPLFAAEMPLFFLCRMTQQRNQPR